MGSGDPTNRFSANSNASLILLYNCPNFRYFSTNNFDALEFAKINIFGISIHHTSLLGIWFAWTLSVLTLIFVKATREGEEGQLFDLGRFITRETRVTSWLCNFVLISLIRVGRPDRMPFSWLRKSNGSGC